MANLWQNITGTVKTAFKIGRTNTATLDASGLTASRAQALPDKAGTLVVQLASGKVDGITNGTATGEVLTFDAIGASVQAYDADLAAIAGLSSSGLIASTGAGTAAARTITGTANQVVVINGDGVSGNPTLSLPQSIDTAASPLFFSVSTRGEIAGTGFSSARYSANTGGPNCTLQKARGTIAAPADAIAGDTAFNLLAQAYDAGAFRTIANLAGRCATGFGGGDSPGILAFQTTPVGSYTQRDVVLFDSAGNVQFVVDGTLNAAAVDVVSLVGVDRINTRHAAAGNRTLAFQSERGSPIYLGDDAIDFSATTGIVSVNGADLLSLTSTAATLAGNLFITGTLPYVDVKPSGWASSGYIQFGVSSSFAASGNYGGIYVPAGKGIAFTQAGTTLFLMDVGGNVGLGVGSTAPLAKFESRVTSGAQIVASFDASNYLSTTVSSAGAVTFDATGASAGFTFSDAVTARSSLTLGVSNTTTGSLVLCGSGGANTHTITAAAIPAATNSYVWPSASPTASQVLTASAPATGVVTLSWATNGVGDVVGPASSVTGAASVFSGTTGKLLRASPTVTYYSVSAGAEDKIEFGATFKDFRTATDGATVTFDLDLSDQWQVTFSGNRTLAIRNASVGQVITILRYQDATGNRTPTWWANIAWDNGLAPVDVPTASGWSMTVLACVGLDAYSVPNWKEVCRSTSAPLTGITTATDGATVTFDLRVSPTQSVTLAGNRTLALTSGSYYVGQTFDIKLTQDATGSRTVTWWSAIKWSGGTIPTLTTTAGKSDWFRFICTDASGSPKFDILGTSMNLGA